METSSRITNKVDTMLHTAHREHEKPSSISPEEGLSVPDCPSMMQALPEGGTENDSDCLNEQSRCASIRTDDLMSCEGDTAVAALSESVNNTDTTAVINNVETDDMDSSNPGRCGVIDECEINLDISGWPDSDVIITMTADTDGYLYFPASSNDSAPSNVLMDNSLSDHTTGNIVGTESETDKVVTVANNTDASAVSVDDTMSNVNTHYVIKIITVPAESRITDVSSIPADASNTTNVVIGIPVTTSSGTTSMVSSTNGTEISSGVGNATAGSSNTCEDSVTTCGSIANIDSVTGPVDGVQITGVQNASNACAEKDETATCTTNAHKDVAIVGVVSKSDIHLTMSADFPSETHRTSSTADAVHGSDKVTEAGDDMLVHIDSANSDVLPGNEIKEDSQRETSFGDENEELSLGTSACNGQENEKNKPGLQLHEQASEETLMCKFCGKSLKTKTSLARHLVNTHTKQNLLKLQECKKDFTRKDTGHRQMQPRKFQCNQCDKRFKEKCHLTSHARIHTGDKQFKCEHCEKKFLRKAHLTSHSLVHKNKSDVEKHQCHECGKTFKSQQYLLGHLVIHSEDKPFRCDQCGKAFRRKTHLRSHVLVHKAEKDYTCLVCGKTFTVNSSLEKHVLLHKERKFPCDFCEKVYSNVYDLKRHTHSHTGMKPFRCMDCDKSYSRRYQLKKHSQVHLSSETGENNTSEKPGAASAEKYAKYGQGLRSFQCTRCIMVFTTKANFLTHLHEHTDVIPLKCDMCEKEFLLESDLKRHIANHTRERRFKCNFCERAFPHRSTLLAHEQAHTKEKPFPCPMCQKSFGTKTHMRSHLRVHTGEKPFQCTMCDLSFTHKSTLSAHEIKVHLTKEPFSCKTCKKTFSRNGHLLRHLRSIGHKLVAAASTVMTVSHIENIKTEVTSTSDYPQSV